MATLDDTDLPFTPGSPLLSLFEPALLLPRPRSRRQEQVPITGPLGEAPGAAGGKVRDSMRLARPWSVPELRGPRSICKRRQYCAYSLA